MNVRRIVAAVAVAAVSVIPIAVAGSSSAHADGPPPTVAPNGSKMR